MSDAMRGYLLGWLAAWLMRLLRATVRLRHHGDGPLRARERAGEPTVYAFWHRHLLLMRNSFRGERIAILSSRHRDGDITVEAMARMGVGAIRGSSTRGGSGALRAMIALVRGGSSLAITPDGPRGPVGVAKPGAVAVAASAGVPIQPIALAASRAWRLASWDRFVVPKPLSRVHLVYGEMFRVERGDDLQAAAAELGRRLDAAEARAERLAAGDDDPSTDDG